MALSQDDLNRFKSILGDYDSPPDDPMMPPNLFTEVTSGNSFETEMATRLSTKLGIPFDNLSDGVTNAMTSNTLSDQLILLGVTEYVVSYIWTVCKAVYPAPLISDFSILK